MHSLRTVKVIIDGKGKAYPGIGHEFPERE